MKKNKQKNTVEVGSKGFIKKLDLKESGLLKKKRGQWFQSTSGERGLKPVLKGFSNFIHKATGNTNQPVKVGGERTLGVMTPV